MALTATLDIRLQDLPEVQEVLKRAADEIADLRYLLRAWEPRVRCLQCGERYRHRACGPTHALVAAKIPDDDGRARPTRPG